ncbi:STAS domain-containing protein [Candidatus Poribacteria bacterium]|nr:STAS domain-containing protein [Candidatus Poribacteria bacterium]
MATRSITIREYLPPEHDLDLSAEAPDDIASYKVMGLADPLSSAEVQIAVDTWRQIQRQKATVQIIDIDTDLIALSSVELRQILEQLISQNTMKVIVNLSRTRRIDSSGLGILVSKSNELRQRGGDLKVYGLSDTLTRIFEQLGAANLEKFIYQNERDALADFELNRETGV